MARTRMSRREAARNLAYCNQQLADPTIPDDRKTRLREKAAFYRRCLVGHCSECGREIRNTNQPGYEFGVGPECWSKQVSA